MKNLLTSTLILMTTLLTHGAILFVSIEQKELLPEKKQVLKYRKVGKVNQKDQNFALPSAPSAETSPVLDRGLLEKIGKLIDKIAPLPKKKNIKKDPKKITPTQNFQFESKRMQAKIFHKIKKEGDHSKILANKSMVLDITPPEGVSEDELNSLEKKFYSFQKRVFQNYLYSFLRVYKQLSMDSPAVIQAIESGRYRLRGKVTYDEDGNILSLKIIKSSLDDNIHELFEKTLTGMNFLPNPPRELLTEEKKLPIFFNLNIN